MNGGVRGRIEGGRGRDELGEGWVTGGCIEGGEREGRVW